jgi:hypothetical protein
MPNGVGVMIGKRIPKAAKPGVVIGEEMERVKDYASEHGLETITDWMRRNGFDPRRDWTRDLNDRWVREMMEEGRTFHDIGPSWERRLRHEKEDKVRHGPEWRRGMENYTRERWHLRDYKDRIRTDEYKPNPRRRGPSCRRTDDETITKQRDHFAEARRERSREGPLHLAA